MVGELKAGDKIVIATHNKGKAKELAELFASVGVDTVSAAELGLPEPEETGHSFVENATLKAEAAARASGLPAVADNSGLEVSALGGAPGIHAARWGGPQKDFGLAMERVHRELEASGSADRTARFVCALAYARPNKETIVAEGKFAERSFGRHAEPAVSAMIRSSCPMAIARPSARWIRIERTSFRIACALSSVLSSAPRRSRRSSCLRRRRSVESSGPFGVYVHWPFCLAKCPYCDFNSHVRHGGIDQGNFVAAYLAELQHFAALAPGRIVSSIFFGGGTPSLMVPETVGAILDRIAALWTVAPERGSLRSQSDIRRGWDGSPATVPQASTACRSACSRSTMRA